MAEETGIRTWREYSAVTGRLVTDLLVLASEIDKADVPLRAYVTFHDQGAQYRVTARWTVGE